MRSHLEVAWNLRLDRDNDLLIVGDRTTPAIGEVTRLTARFDIVLGLTPAE